MSLHIVYLHGFNSAGAGSDKAKMLIDFFGPEFVTAPDLPHEPDRAVEVIATLLGEILGRNKTLANVVLVGCSLGGFYAHYFNKLLGIKAVLLNPSMDPITTMVRYLGPNKNHKTGVEYDLTPDHIDMFAKFYLPVSPARVSTIVAVDLGDEVLDAAKTASMFLGHADVRVFKNGSHRFEHLEELLGDIAKLEHIIFE